MPNDNRVAGMNLNIQKLIFDSSSELDDEFGNFLPPSSADGNAQWAELEEDLEPVVIESDEIELSREEVPPPKRETRDAILDAARLEADSIIASANKLVEEIRAGAEKEKIQAVEDSKKIGYDLGFKEGEIAGEAHAKEAYVRMMQDATKEFVSELQSILDNIRAQKAHFAKKYFNELCEMALNVAEKVIHVSLKSSGQVIEKMVIAATEKSADKLWATVHISDIDEKMLIKGDINLLDAVKHISPKLKLEIVPDGSPGTCIIEFPDQIIDASVDTQMQNIKELIENQNMNGDV